MRYKIVLSYSGKDFSGWQIQPGACTVQETLEKALGTLTGSPVPVTGAGRTDTAVSAVGYVAHFDVPSELDANRLLCKLNAILPPSVAVMSLSAAEDDFHARFDAKRREYCYFLHRCKDPFLDDRSYLFAYPEVDFGKMNLAASLLVGTHDFSCFQKTGSDNKTSVCTVFEAGWHSYTPSHVAIMGSVCEAQEEQYWYFRIAADRFLRNMVRAVVGTLLEIGRDRRSIENFESLLGGGGRHMAGESVPGHALFLSGVDY